MLKNEKNPPKTALYLPEDPSRTALPREAFRELMREPRCIRKRKQRAGECTAPSGFICGADCNGCYYYTKQVTISLDAVREETCSRFVYNNFEDRVLDHIAYEQALNMIRRLDIIDRIIILAKYHQVKPLTNEMTASLIHRETGRSYSAQAVSKRTKKALQRLRDLMGVEKED